MAIDLLNRFTSGQVNNAAAAQTAQTGSTVVSESAEAARILRNIYALKAGDTMQGELISAKGTDISLLLGDVVTLSAKLDKELFLTPGQFMTFTVNSNKNGKLSLSPLFANTGMEQNAIKALDAASIPVTDKTLAMAEELMKQGMPINKQTLSTVFRQMGMYPEAEIADIVMLNKMNIPVTDENASMMHLYRTNQQYLFSDLQGLSAQISEVLSGMAADGQTDAVSSFIKGFLQIFSSSQGESSGINEGQSVNARMFAGTPESGMMTGDKAAVGNGTETAGTAIVEHQSADGKIIITENGSPANAENMANMQKSAAAAKEAELLELLRSDGIKTENGKAQLTQNIVTILKEQMLMNPEEVNSADYVKEFYERLDSQMGRLQNLLKSVGKENSALGKEVNTVKSNIQFMNQINELYHYVQLPIKMNYAEAKGDLYVYKRKHAKTGDDGKLTALLHLSMPTLGNMDVFLSLEGQKLSTRFCLEKEELIDFIESHIDQLNDRLMEKGYLVQTNVIAGTKEEKSVIEHIIENEQPIPIMTSQSFDARC